MMWLTLPLAAVRLALAGLLAAGAMHKLRDFPGLCSAMSSYVGGTPLQGAGMVKALAMGVASAEAVAALAIAGSWSPPFTVFGAVAGVAIFLVYAAVMAFNILRGNRIADCGCTFGGQGKQAVGPVLVLRNVLLALAAATVAVPVQPTLMDAFGIICLAAMLLLMYAVWNELDANGAITGENR